MTIKRYNEWRYRANLEKKRKIEKRCNKYQKKCQDYEERIIELATEDGKEKAWQEKYIKSKAYMAIIIGTGMLLVTFFLSYSCEISKWNDTTKAICNAAVTALNSVCSIVIGIGISTLVLDFFSYIKYTRNRIKEIMIEKKYIETLSNEEKRKLIESAEHSLYFKNGEVTDNSLYANIKELIIPLIEENYFKQYKVHVDCYVKEEEKIIIKRVHKIMDIVRIGKEDFQIPFSTYMHRIAGRDNSELYKITKCVCNEKDITKEVVSQIKLSNISIGEEANMEVKFSVEYNFHLKKGLNRIEVCTETIVPIMDKVYAHTITIPCQRYSSNYSVHNLDYEVIGYGFAFDDPNHKDKIDRVIYKDKYDDCFKIRFENWTLPGDGVVFMINKKEKM